MLSQDTWLKRSHDPCSCPHHSWMAACITATHSGACAWHLCKAPSLWYIGEIPCSTAHPPMSRTRSSSTCASTARSKASSSSTLGAAAVPWSQLRWRRRRGRGGAAPVTAGALLAMMFDGIPGAGAMKPPLHNNRPRHDVRKRFTPSLRVPAGQQRLALGAGAHC
jgi:hypothetical protein